MFLNFLVRCRTFEFSKLLFVSEYNQYFISVLFLSLLLLYKKSIYLLNFTNEIHFQLLGLSVLEYLFDLFIYCFFCKARMYI
ncbi:hypothetical protein XELAEV_18014191mg [Xenopus laevis]|uniref:Uncharacterized protein n=1 Tax=Xenopus laevis TaxID=8355 RepID=A0A974DHP1_XENLA|nr:hypothetical protein XELAEV_18014191mg [Xenopus laevis]